MPATMQNRPVSNNPLCVENVLIRVEISTKAPKMISIKPIFLVYFFIKTLNFRQNYEKFLITHFSFLIFFVPLHPQFAKSMNQYETVFILTPVLSDEQMKETVAKFKKVLTDKGAEILNEETWGLKKMAYAIQKKSTGFYCLLEFKAEPSVIKTLETSFRRDEKVIRFQTVKLEKYAIEYAEKRRNKLGKKEEA